MQRRIIGLAGPARCGKDTVAAHLWDKYKAEMFAFADPLKKAAAVLLGRPESEMYGDYGYNREAIMPEWGFSVRHFLQKLGTEGMREVFREDFWIVRMEVELAQSNNHAVITDVRFENEADFVRKQGGTIWHIQRPVDNGLDETAKTHASEAGIKMEIGDTLIINDSTIEDLEKVVEAVWDSYG